MPRNHKANPSQKTIGLVFASHLDIGYTAPPDRIERLYKQQLDEALDLCRQYPEYRYTIEASWIMRQWLKRTDNPRIRREMIRRINDGQIEVCAPFASMHSSVIAPEQANQLCYDVRRIREELGIEVVTAMQNDVPGYTWAYPQILRKSGIQYLYVGINDSLGGGLAVRPQTRPLYWKGIDGSSILLQTNRLYTLHHPKILDWFWMRDGNMEKTLQDMEDLFQGNPCDTVLLLALPGDNKGPLENLFTFQQILEWNRQPRPFRVEAMTPRHYFKHIESKFVSSLETWHGDWPASFEWDLTKVRAPQATTAYRHAQAHLPTVEKLLAVEAISKKKEFPRYDVAQAYEELLNYGEHTAPEGHATPALTRREILWSNQCHHFSATRALHLAEGLYPRTELRLGLPPGEDRILLFNPLGWQRTETVQVPIPAFRGNFEFCRKPIQSLTDLETGETIPVVHNERGEWRRAAVGGDRTPCISFCAKNIPPFGFRAYRANLVSEGDPEPACAGEAKGASIENEKYSLELDPATGNILSLFDRELRREIVGGRDNAGNGVSFNAIESGTLPPSAKVSIRKIKTSLFETLIVRRKGSWIPQTEYRLDAGSLHFVFRNHIDRAQWKRLYPSAPVMEAKLHLPLRLSASSPNIVVSGPTGFRRIPQDILPGAPCNTWPSSAFISLDDGKTCTTIASPSDYLFRPGTRKGDFFDLHTQCVWQAFQVASRSAGSQILPCTEPEEEGVVMHEYALTSHASPFDPMTAQQFGWNFRTEMIGFHTTKTQAEEDYAGVYPIPYGIPFRTLKPFSRFTNPAESFIHITVAKDRPSPLINILAFRQSLFPRQNHWILRLQEMVGAPRQTIRIQFAREFKFRAAWQATILEEKTNPLNFTPNGLQLSVGPFETLTIGLAP